ncbi:MAG: ectoine/hydroxyectoine ABC transporter permease subunit EhuD [Chromatiales bacterium]|jgi:polar amino acid transport system permease protein
MFDWHYALSLLPQLLEGFEVTLLATAGGMLLALLLGLLWAVLRRAAPLPLAWVVRWLVEFIRSTPLLVQLYFLFFVLPDFGLRLSPFATGVLALGLHYSAYTAEVYRAGIEAIPRHQWEAALALNLGRTRTWVGIILPQAIPPVIPALGNYLIAMLKDSPLLAAITVSEILQIAKLIGAESFRYLEPLTLVGLLFLLVSLLSSRLIGRLEKRYGRI